MKKIFAINTKLLMYYNAETKAVQDLEVGDCLMTADSGSDRIISISRDPSSSPIYNVVCFDGAKCSFNASHVLVIQDNYGCICTYPISNRVYGPAQYSMRATIAFPTNGTAAEAYYAGASSPPDCIPEKYKYNSRENRLYFLAGLLDMYGFIYQFPATNCCTNSPECVYGLCCQYGAAPIPAAAATEDIEMDGSSSNTEDSSVTESSPQVFEDIFFLIRSLGFVFIKYEFKEEQIGVAGFYIHIYGKNLDEIPTRILRRQHSQTFSPIDPMFLKFRLNKQLRPPQDTYQIRTENGENIVLDNFLIV